MVILGFGTTGYNAVAKNYKMPAMSPTMTEGNIVSWKVKEGTKEYHRFWFRSVG